MSEKDDRPQDNQEPADSPPDTISILDLIDQANLDDQKESGRTEKQESQKDRHQGAGAPIVTDDDQATPTGPSIPALIPRPDPQAPPPPLIAHDETALVPPPQRDQEATQVQPRVAFPGSTDPAAKRAMIEPPKEPESEIPPEPPAGSPPAQPARHIAPPRRQRPQPRTRDTRPAAEPLPVPLPSVSRVDAPARSTPAPEHRPRSRRRRSCVGRFIIIGLLLGVAFLLLGSTGLVAGYTLIARDLPSPAELESRASTFETAIIYDRDGNQLYTLADPNTGNRTVTPLSAVSPDLINATIATEDARFYVNPGFDPIGIGRAIYDAAREREIVSGASTITQQLVRALFLEEEERAEVTFRRKVREIVLAAELNRTYPGREGKDKILELYLNEIYYGNLAYGIEAAAQTYFGKSAAELTLPEASLLAGLPQSPAVYDPFSDPERVLERQAVVLGLMVQEGFITDAQAQEAINESAVTVRNLTPPEIVIRHPHFVFTVLQQLENEFGAQAIYQGGFRIFTTLDPVAQEIAETALADGRENTNALGANNGSLVALRPDTGEVLALVGSFDFNDEDIRGQVNMALAPRQPGSTLKPLVYLSAFEQGWTPSTLLWDTETEFPDPPNAPYVPANFDDQFHGPVLLRYALGNSYNIPAVKALEFVGVCQFVAGMQRLNLTSLLDDGCLETGVPRDAGLSLALGGKEISPLDMAVAYAALANQGIYHEPYTISHIENSRGDNLFTYAAPDPAGNQALRPAHTFLITDILSDDEARRGEFGANSPLTLDGRPVAAKTGTSGANFDDIRDGWTIGYTPQVVTAVWVGNTDAEPVNDGASGFRLATPIWNQFMTRYLADKAALPFLQPASVVQLEICADSGTRPGPGCPQRVPELFAADQLPLDNDRDFLQQIPVDLWTLRAANDFCPENTFTATFVNLLVSGRPEVIQRETINARQWVENTPAGQTWANARNIGLPLQLPPAQECEQGGVRPAAEIKWPSAGSELLGNVEVTGRANSPNFNGFVLQYGLTHDPGGWAEVAGRQPNPVVDGVLGQWDTGRVGQSGPVTLRLLVFGPDNPYTPDNDPVVLETRVPVNLIAPTSTPTPSPTVTPSPTATGTPTATPTASPSPSATATATPDPGLLTPSPTPTLPPPTPTPTTEPYP